MAQNTHIGEMINRLLEEQHLTKARLGQKVGISASNAVHLTTRASVDMRLLQKVGNALKYNFFKHFPIDEGKAAEFTDPEKVKQQLAEKDKTIEALKAEIAHLQKQMEETRLKQENEYLREMNDLLKSSLKPALLRMRSAQPRRKSLGNGERRLMLGEGE